MCEKSRWMNYYRKENQNSISSIKHGRYKDYLLVYVNCGQVTMSEVCCAFAESKAIPLVAVLLVVILFLYVGR